jgi:hypothetical protein
MQTAEGFKGLWRFFVLGRLKQPLLAKLLYQHRVGKSQVLVGINSNLKAESDLPTRRIPSVGNLTFLYYRPRDT